MAAAPIILCLNVGSSSLKFSLFECTASAEQRLAEGEVERIGRPGSQLWLRRQDGGQHKQEADFADHGAALAAAFAALIAQQLPAPMALGHRLVHGGPHHSRPERIDAALLQSLRAVVPFAPLHLPTALAVIEQVAARYPALPQVACFDTAFHAALPEVARRLPLPQALAEKGLRRYGFHGLSYDYLVTRLGAQALGRAVLMHLGSGASMAAVRDGQPVDTTMGLTPTGGFMMGTRTGDLDPGVLLYLLNHGFTAQQLAQLVDHDSGLLGVSGLSGDMRQLLEQRAHSPRAALAVAMFVYQVRKSVGALVAALGGIDTLVFTGGIGEHAAPVRAECCAGLAHLGIRIDQARNAAAAPVISTADSQCTVRVVPTDEALMIARYTRQLCFDPAAAAQL